MLLWKVARMQTAAKQPAFISSVILLLSRLLAAAFLRGLFVSFFEFWGSGKDAVCFAFFND